MSVYQSLLPSPFQARRREDDISIVTGCMHVRLSPIDHKWVVEHVGMGFGGMAPLTKAAPQTQAFLQVRPQDSCVYMSIWYIGIYGIDIGSQLDLS
jgi:hypothetical protein